MKQWVLWGGVQLAILGLLGCEPALQDVSPSTAAARPSTSSTSSESGANETPAKTSHATSTPTTATTPPTATTTAAAVPPGPGAFAFGAWTWLGGKPCRADASVIHTITSATVRGNTLRTTYSSDAGSFRWWTPVDPYSYGPHAMAYKGDDGKWYAAYVDWFGMNLSTSREFVAPWKHETPFAAHPPTRGTEAYWFVYSGDGRHRTNVVRINWQ